MINIPSRGPFIPRFGENHYTYNNDLLYQGVFSDLAKLTEEELLERFYDSDNNPCPIEARSERFDLDNFKQRKFLEDLATMDLVGKLKGRNFVLDHMGYRAPQGFIEKAYAFFGKYPKK
jgi:hypothetical protein